MEVIQDPTIIVAMQKHKQTFYLFRVYRFQDTKAYAALYDLYFDRIRRFLYFKLPTEKDADELTAEVFLRGWEYATSSRVEHAGALFYRIARNITADYYRKNSITEVDISEAKQMPANDDLEERVMIHDESRLLLQKLKKLQANYQEILIMRFLDEMSIKEIADALEERPNNIRVRLHRAKKALQEIA